MSSPHKGRVRSPLSSSFLHDLASGLVPIFVLGLCLVFWVFYCASRVLHEEVTFATYWTTKLTLTNTLVQFGVVDHQTPKSKVNGPRVHFPYNSNPATQDLLVRTRVSVTSDGVSINPSIVQPEPSHLKTLT